ncbi:Putative amidoligase enzyme [Paenibacillaceae bacterium GAS479]|nr:Putative amidoligase enzyme [Paenibacillaceae bacterium GAS479]
MNLLEDWKTLRFGVEIEFIGGEPEKLELLPGWNMALNERQIDENGAESGSELQAPPLFWEERDQIREMLDRLRQQGASTNWSCGLHVHVELARYGESILIPLLETALQSQHALSDLLDTSPHRLLFCPMLPADRVEESRSTGDPAALRNSGRPQSHRFGVNINPWFEIGTVEIRFANGSLDDEEVARVVELCLRFVAAVGAGTKLPDEPAMLARVLGAPVKGYPCHTDPPRWQQERTWLEELLIPLLAPLVEPLVPGGEIYHILPEPGGIAVFVEAEDDSLIRFLFRPGPGSWELRPEMEMDESLG